jgi:hypothetical protein
MTKEEIIKGIPPTATFVNRKRGPLDKDNCKKNLLDIKKCFDVAGVHFWLMFGTLLGAIRDGDFIEHDHDTDLGVWFDDLDKVCLAITGMEQMGFEVVRTDLDMLVSVMRHGEYIDFFRFKKQDDGVSCCNETHIATKRLTIPEGRLFLGQMFNVPMCPEVLLYEQYGKEWYTSIKNKPARAI